MTRDKVEDVETEELDEGEQYREPEDQDCGYVDLVIPHLFDDIRDVDRFGLVSEDRHGQEGKEDGRDVQRE